MVRQEAVFKPSAAPTETPKDVRITNVGHNWFSVSWVTSSPTSGFISYGKNASVGTVVESPGKNMYVHQVDLTSLNAQTDYYFKIGVGQQGINKSKLYSLKTGPSLKDTPAPDIVFGQAQDAQKQLPIAGAVVYLTAAGVAPLSAVTDSKGKWSLNLASARRTDLKENAIYDKNETLLEIFVQAGNEKFSSAKIKTGAARPVPIMTLGKTHDFTNLKPASDGKVPSSELDLANVVPAASPSPSPSPKSGFSQPQGLAKASPSPTPKVSPKPTPSTSPKVVAATGSATIASTTGSLPSAGNLTATMFIFIMGMVLVIVGLFVPQTA